MKQQNEELIIENQEKIIYLLKLLLKDNKKEAKLNDILLLAKKFGVVDVNQIEQCVSWKTSRQSTLNYMKAVTGENPDKLRFIKGSRLTQTPSRIIFIEDNDKIFKKLDTYFIGCSKISFRDIALLLDTSELQKVEIVANEYINQKNGVYVDKTIYQNFPNENPFDSIFIKKQEVQDD